MSELLPWNFIWNTLSNVVSNIFSSHWVRDDDIEAVKRYMKAVKHKLDEMSQNMDSNEKDIIDIKERMHDANWENMEIKFQMKTIQSQMKDLNGSLNKTISENIG